MLKPLSLTLICAGLVALAAPAGAAAKAVNFAGASSDAAAVFFTDDSRLVGADTDSLIDVYERAGGVTTLISVPGVGASGAPAAAFFGAVSDDGTKVFFATAENLVTADTDGLIDIYERSGGTTTLVSVPGVGSSGTPGAAQSPRVSSDGSVVFFETGENLVAADTDGINDIYQRSGSATTLVSVEGVGSTGPAGGVQLQRVSTDGSRAFFTTSANFIGADTDGLSDIYERSGATTSLVSAREVGGSGPDTIPGLRAISADGSRVYFNTAENMVASDSDGLQDAYERSAGTTSLISVAGTGASGSPGGAAFNAASSDGTKLLFDTPENMVTADTDGLSDVYERSSGTTTLISEPGAGAVAPADDENFEGLSSDGTVAFFGTTERLVTADVDAAYDLYKRSAGTTALVTPEGVGASGPVEDMDFRASSSDGATVIFETEQNMVAADTDAARDVYQNTGGTTTLLSAPGAGGTPSAVNTAFRRASTDGSRVIFGTGERLTGADPDPDQDLYERAAGTTTLLSGESGPPLGLPPDTTISGGPPSTTTETVATFSFTSSEFPATFECRLDGAGFEACSSPFSASGLSVGPHTFEVRSTDFALNIDPTPASLAFNVVSPPPAPPAAVTPAKKKCKKGQKLKKGKCVKKKRRK